MERFGSEDPVVKRVLFTVLLLAGPAGAERQGFKARWEEAELWAADKWASALGPGYAVPVPPIVWGSCGSSKAIACTNGTKIYVDEWLWSDKRTVMLHELGHVLGLPHVPGDPLMDPSYHTPVAEPPAADVAWLKGAQRR